MEPQVINHEILLFTGSSFCSRKLCKRTGDDESPHDLSSMEESLLEWDVVGNAPGIGREVYAA